jgi:hypothetical protein
MALVYVVGGALAIILSIRYHYNKEHFGLAFMIGGLVPLIILRRERGRGNRKKRMESKLDRSGISLKIGFMLFLICITVILLEYRNWSIDYSLQVWFFVVVALAASIILIQIANLNNRSSIGVITIIIEVVTLAVTISASFEFLFASPYGNDAPFHVSFINSIMSNGTISGPFGQYETYPIYHITFVALSDVLDSNIMESLLWMSFIQIGFGIFLFLTARRFLGVKIALLSFLLISVAPNLLVSRYSFYPGGFSVIFLMLILYLITRKKRFRDSRGTTLVLVFTFVAISFHPLLPIFILALLLLVNSGKRLLQIKSESSSQSDPSSSKVVVLIAMMTVFWWMRPLEGSHNDLLAVLTNSALDAIRGLDFTNVGQATLAPTLPFFDILLSDLGFALLILMGVVGSVLLLGGYSLENNGLRSSAVSSVRVVSLAALCIVPLPFALAIVYPNSLPSRWYPCLEVLLSIGAAVFVLPSISNVRKLAAKAAVSLLFFTVIFLFISSPTVNPNGGIYANNLSSRSALTSSEYQAMVFINGLNLPDVHINSKYIFIDNNQYSQWINPNQPSTYSSGLTVIRNYDLINGFTIPLFGRQGALFEIVPANLVFNETLSRMDLIYDVGSVHAFSG